HRGRVGSIGVLDDFRAVRGATDAIAPTGDCHIDRDLESREEGALALAKVSFLLRRAHRSDGFSNAPPLVIREILASVALEPIAQVLDEGRLSRPSTTDEGGEARVERQYDLVEEVRPPDRETVDAGI